MKTNIIGRMLIAAIISAMPLVGIGRNAGADQKTKTVEEKKQKKERPQARHEQKAQQQKQDQPPGWDKGKKSGWGDNNVPPGHQPRLSQQRQKLLIAEEQRRLVQYRQYLEQQQRRAEQNTAQLQKQRRLAQYRYQQQYFERMRQQQTRLQSERRDYSNDPYYYTAPIYRYKRGDIFYETNQYGADQLRLAANNGYEQGFRAGQADRQDRWRANYKDSFAYQDASYGYGGYYVSQADYNYYFREGFSRGYEDGYNSRSQYGNQANGSYSILGGILSQILNLQPLR